MRISSVDAFALRVPSPVGQTYWGSKAWASTPMVLDIEGPPALWEEYPPRWRMRATYSATINTVIVKITTDTGLIGFGEAKAPVAPEATRDVVLHLLAPVAIGADPLDIDVIWERMYSTMRLRAHQSGFLLEAIAGVDLALWDLVGKALGASSHKLLGGAYRNRIKVYASGLPGLKDESDAASRKLLQDSARALIARGFRAIKLAVGFGVEVDVATVRLVREVVGNDVLLLCDAAGNYSAPEAGRLGRVLESLRVGWLEAPVPPEDIEGHRTLAQSLDLPVATDLISTRYQVRDFLVRAALDIVQPDVCRAGGLSECRRIAHLADTFGVGCAPHVSIGSAIQFAATAQFAAAIPNFVIMEYWIGENPIGDAAVRVPMRLENGMLTLPSGPGLGLDIVEERLLRYAV